MPSGVGLYSQLSNLSALGSNFSSLGLGVGIVKYVAEFSNKNNKDLLRRLFATVIWLPIIIILFTITAGILFKNKLSLWLLGNYEYENLILIALISIPFSVLVNFLVSFLQGFKEIKKIAIYKVSSSFIALIILIPIVIIWKLKGAVISIILLSIVSFIILSFILKNVLNTKDIKFNILKPSFDVFLIKLLLFYGIASLTIGILSCSIDIFLRSRIIHILGSFQNGIYQSSQNLSNIYINIVTAAMSLYIYPHLSSISDYNELSKEINNNIKLSLMITVPFICIVLTVSPILVPLIFSNEFLPVTGILPYQSVNDFIKACTWSLGIVFLAQNRIKIWFTASIIALLPYLFIGFLFLQNWGIKSLLIGYTIGWTLCFFFYLFWLKKIFSIKVLNNNKKLIFSSLALICLISYFSRINILLSLFCILLLFFWFLLNVQKSEFEAFIKIVKTWQRLA